MNPTGFDRRKDIVSYEEKLSTPFCILKKGRLFSGFKCYSYEDGARSSMSDVLTPSRCAISRTTFFCVGSK